MKKNIPYGNWPSPLDAKEIYAHRKGLSQSKVFNNTLYWVEMRPSEKGRSLLFSYNGSTKEEVLPKEYSVRSKVYEYGGGAYCVADKIYFVNQHDQKIYAFHAGKARPITPEGPYRYGDLQYDAKRKKLYCIREEHTKDDVEHTIVCLDPDTEDADMVVAAGHDFYTSPVISPDGHYLVFVTWDHPNMPWDKTSLRMHQIHHDGSLHEGEIVQEGVSIFQPQFGTDGHLYFASDETGFWNLYRYKEHKVEKLFPYEAEFGLPNWVFGQSTYAFAQREDLLSIVTTYIKEGEAHLGVLSLNDFSFTQIELPFTSYSYLQVKDKFLYFIGSSDMMLSSVIELNMDDFSWKVIEEGKHNILDENYISVAEKISFPTEDGERAYGFFYPPCNPHCTGLESERPPLIVKCHGGPTGMTSRGLHIEVQYWTSRGFAFLDVNYRGSTGFGKNYRDKLKENWGIVDVNDIASGALYLADEGLVDRDRMVIKGSSAGGYSVLAALAFRDVFTAGVSYYGVSNLIDLAEETHKFEARYLDQLVGPYPARKDIYEKRSPIKHLDNFHAALLILQGEKDFVVPKKQADKMYEALKEKLPVFYLLFSDEGHGFRKKENLTKALEAEHAFYCEIFGLELPPKIEKLSSFQKA